MIYLICTFERKGMQCKARRAAQGGPLSKRRTAGPRNAAMRPFAWAAPANPPGSRIAVPHANRSLAAFTRGQLALAVAPLRRVAAPCIRPGCVRCGDPTECIPNRS